MEAARLPGNLASPRRSDALPPSSAPACDVSHCLEFYADFSGHGRNYRQFPDRTGFRIYLEDLREPRDPRPAARGLARAAVTRAPLDPVEQDQRLRGRVDIIHELHHRIDAATARAYGWAEARDDAEIVARLVALNADRAREERSGTVRWLRPSYQLERRGVDRLGGRGDAASQIEAALTAPLPRKPMFPRDALGQTAAVLQHLRSGSPMTAAAIAALYTQGQRAAPRIEATLAALARLGHVAMEGGGYRLRQAA